MIGWLKRLLGFERVVDHEDDDPLRDFTMHEVLRTGVVVLVMRRSDGLFIRYGSDPWIRLGPVPADDMAFAAGVEGARVALARGWIVPGVLPHCGTHGANATNDTNGKNGTNVMNGTNVTNGKDGETGQP